MALFSCALQKIDVCVCVVKCIQRDYKSNLLFESIIQQVILWTKGEWGGEKMVEKKFWNSISLSAFFVLVAFFLLFFSHSQVTFFFILQEIPFVTSKARWRLDWPIIFTLICYVRCQNSMYARDYEGIVLRNTWKLSERIAKCAKAKNRAEKDLWQGLETSFHT